MIKPKSRNDAGDNGALFDPADVKDASALESSSGRHNVVGTLWRMLSRVALRKRFMLAMALFGLVAALYAMRLYGYLSPGSIMSFLGSHPVVAPIIFAVIYAVMVVCLVPTFPLNLGAGLIWGPYGGGLLTVIGAGTGSALAFLAARYIASDYLNKKFNHSAWQWLRDEITRKEWKVVVFTRVNPIFPFGPTSYFFGLTPIRFGRYLLTTLLAITPLSLLIAAMGSSIGDIVLQEEAYGLMKNILAVLLAVTLLFALKIVIRRLIK